MNDITLTEDNENINYLLGQYMQLYQYLPSASLVCLTDGFILNANQQFCQMTSYNLESVMHKSLFKFLALQKRNESFLYLEKLSIGEYACFERKMIGNNKDERKITVKFIPAIKQDALIGMYVTFIDKVNRNVQGTLDILPRVEGFGNWEYDAINDKISASEEVFRIFEAEPSDFHNNSKHFFGLLTQDEKSMTQKAIMDCQRGKSFEIEHKIVRPNKALCYIIIRGEPAYDEVKRMIGIRGTIQDITQLKKMEREMKKSFNSLSKTQSLSHIGSWEFSLEQDMIKISEEGYHIFGLSPADYDGTFYSFSKIVHPDDLYLMKNIIDNPPKETSVEMEFRIIWPTTETRYIHQIMELNYNQEGKLSSVIGTSQDITEKKEMLKEITLSNQLIVKESRSFYMITDENAIIKSVSINEGNLYGYEINEIIGHSLYSFPISEDRQRIKEMFETSLLSPNKNIESNIRIKSRFGKEIYYQMAVVNSLSILGISGIVIYCYDITERVEMEQKASYLVRHNEMTNLPNRLSFQEHMTTMCDNFRFLKKGFALFMIDIDNLKYINDALGYQIVDQLIAKIAERLKKFTYDKSRLYHYGGDEFAIIITGILHISEYESYAKDILALFTQSFKVDNFELYVTISMGISICPNDGQETEILKKHANIALLRSKNQGKNKYRFYTADMDVQNYKEFELRNDLYKSIEVNQIKVYYQPIVNLETNEIIAAEALIRWEHPTWGLVQPDEFIPIAIDSGFIVELGKWLLEKVCENYCEWLHKGLTPIKVSISYLSIQFYEKNFVENILSTIRRYKLEPSFLIMDIVANILIKDISQILPELQRLKEEKIQTALDNYGIGYSSLEYIKRFHIDIIKIDRSFVKTISKEDTGAIIAESIIDLAKKLSIKVIAQGIENWEQLLTLQNFNCYAGQGHLFSDPVSEEEFRRILGKKKCRPIKSNDLIALPFTERRKYFRMTLPALLEAYMTIIEVGGQTKKLGNTKIIIQNIGPGGLRFLSNIRFPIQRDMILRFGIRLMGKDINVYGYPLWEDKVRENVNAYGIMYTINENERAVLTQILNQYQIRLRNNNGQYEGDFYYESIPRFFNIEEDENLIIS